MKACVLPSYTERYACFVTRDEKCPFFDDFALIKSPEI